MGRSQGLAYSSVRAQPPLDFLPPAFDGKVANLVRWLMPSWIRWHERIVDIDYSQVEHLATLHHGFQQGKNRFLIAFRHPSPADPYLLAQLVWRQLPQTAKALDLPLAAPIHAHFLYDRGIPLWAGQRVGWLYSKLGGTSIQRGKVDRQGLRSARHLFANGRFPLAAAPEGGNNGHSEIVSPLEPGVAQFGFWCVEDMLKAQRPESVYLLPVGIAYRYETPPWPALGALLASLESDVGLPATAALPALPPALATADWSQQLYPRLYRLGDYLLERMEAYYQDFYGLKAHLPATAETSETQLTLRLQALLDAALQVAESYFQLPQRGSVIERCRRIEQAGWDRIYREELEPNRILSPVERGLADRIAEEASLRMWHMRLVENFVAVTGSYVRQKATAERFAETLLLLRDTVLMTQGKNPFPRPKLGNQVGIVKVGQPISVSDRWSHYRTSRKQAVAELTQDLQAALEQLIADNGRAPG